MRLPHYSIHTERTYVEWIKRYVQFHHRTCREDLAGGEAKIEAWLGHQDVATMMIDTPFLQPGGHGVASPLDDLQGSAWRRLRGRSNRRHAFPSCYATCIRGNHRPSMGMMERWRKLFVQLFFAGRELQGCHWGRAGLIVGMKKNSVVEMDPEIMSGTPCFAGTRVPARTLIDYLEGGHTLDDFLEDFPTVSRKQAIAFLEEASKRMLVAA